MSKKEKPNNTAYIMQISASDYESARNTAKDHKVTPQNLPINKNYLYLGTMPDSVELRYIRQQFPDEFFLHTNKSKKQVWRTNCIIDIVFDRPYKIEIDNKTVAYVSRDGKSVEEKPAKKTQTKVTELRKAFYTKGFSLWIDGKEHKYVFYLRGSSKVKEGHCLFLDEQYADQMSQWGFMGLDFTHDASCDMISLFAYRSLTTSGIIDTVKIEPVVV